jgi:hypothetical protein
LVELGSCREGGSHWGVGRGGGAAIRVGNPSQAEPRRPRCLTWRRATPPRPAPPRQFCPNLTIIDMPGGGAALCDASQMMGPGRVCDALPGAQPLKCDALPGAQSLPAAGRFVLSACKSPSAPIPHPLPKTQTLPTPPPPHRTLRPDIPGARAQERAAAERLQAGRGHGAGQDGAAGGGRGGNGKHFLQTGAGLAVLRTSAWRRARLGPPTFKPAPSKRPCFFDHAPSNLGASTLQPAAP